MKRHWFLFALIALAVAATMGCEQAQPTVAEPTAQAPPAEGLAVDPSILPPPRAALELAPDLSGASLVINDATLAKMAADAVPSSVVDALRTLQGRQFGSAAEFAAAVRTAVGDGADAQMGNIMRNALVIALADEPPAPEGEVSIAQREERQAVAAAEAAAQPMSKAASEFGIVYFDFDKSEIKPEFASVIQQNARLLMGNAALKVTLEGHCDERGTNEYNLALGQRRAEAIRRALIAAGVSAGQLSTVSFGEERPVELGHDEAAWEKNRRAVVVIN